MVVHTQQTDITMDAKWIKQHLYNILQSFSSADLLIQWVKSIGYENHPDVTNRLYEIYLRDKVLTYTKPTDILGYAIPLGIHTHPIVLQRLQEIHRELLQTVSIIYIKNKQYTILIISIVSHHK